MFQRIVASGLFAGAGAGLLAALLQLLFLQPVLIEAERYESGELTHFGGPVDAAHDHSSHDHGDAGAAEDDHDHSAHDHGEEEEAHDHGAHDHGDGSAFLPREAMVLVFSIAVYAGYGLILAAGMIAAEGAGASLGWRTGMIWGVAGFVALHLAPAFSLAPEVPGVAAADVSARQIWWFATVAATGLALWLIAFGRSLPLWLAALALILAPHIVGAPEAGPPQGPVPPEVAALFASRALGVGLAVWVVLGALAGFFLAGRSDEVAS